MTRKEKSLKKLTEVPDEEWQIAMLKCQKLINWRIKGRTRYGCHSEKRLGMPVFDYYFHGAIEKLYDGVWEWKDQYSLAKQLHRIIGSMISDEVRKYKVEQKKPEKNHQIVPFDEQVHSIGEELDEFLTAEEKENISDRQLELIEKAIEGDPNMESVYLLKLEGKSSKEICEELGWERKKFYRVNAQMCEQVKILLMNLKNGNQDE